MSAHELLLRLAGRMSDRQLWRFRDWLAADALDAVARSLPLTLLREKVAITPEEYKLAVNALMAHGADAERLNALPWVDEIVEVDYTFSAESPDWVSMGDSVAVVLGAILRGRPEVVEARSSWRRSRSGGGSATRVVLVTTSGDGAHLTGELQRVLRALGTYEPAVEVLPRTMEPPRYHRAAFAASEPLVAQDQLVSS
ncbi:hypothetical protein V5P93_000293 [Actinokineospora auranticolor]|uniref:Uncharacterized protein n=1 Tax=Actinokineospora auranticolor TaxID=155976 RepID=A0A2S6GKS9_9PSEU|nr:hypothetical protein [Actinokineospora auranticolor]PPK65819.1 hypothetical protein CLV40_11280 [Actinokineospora auranticolor]